jgi:hypothetical protein
MRDPAVMDGMGALVLPRAIALADADVAAIARFAATRLVIADCQLGFFNHRLQKRDTPALDELFGITRTILGTVDDYTTAQEDCGSGSCLVAAEPGVRPTGATSAHVVGTEPLVLVQSTGAGRTAYLNLRIGSYVHDRLARPEAAERLRSLLRPLFVLGRVRPRFEVTQIDEGPRWPFAVHARKDGADTLLAVELAATTGSREIDWTALPEARPKVRIGLRATFRVTDLSSGEPLGTESAIEAEIDAGRPALFRLAP